MIKFDYVYDSGLRFLSRTRRKIDRQLLTRKNRELAVREKFFSVKSHILYALSLMEVKLLKKSESRIEPNLYPSSQQIANPQQIPNLNQLMKGETNK
jgi:hypothetical protein